MSQFCVTCGEPRVLGLGEATVALPMTARDLLEMLWHIAIAANNPTPNPEGDGTQRLVARLELALSLVSDTKPPSVEIAEASEASATTQFEIPGTAVEAFDKEEVTRG